MSDVAQLGEEFLLAEIAVFVCISLVDEFHDIGIADNDVQVLVEDALDFVEANQSLLFPIEQLEHLFSLGLSPLPSKPLFRYHFLSLSKGEGILAGVVANAVDFFFDLLSVHLREGEIA